MSKGWAQVLFVAVPVLSLVGSWLALRTFGQRRDKHENDEKGQDERSKGE